MSIIVGDDTKLVISGLTGREGTFHGLRNRDYGTDVVAGVTPKKGGQDVEGIPVYDTIKEAVDDQGANISMIFVPARFAAAAINEAVDAGVETVIAITEGIPVHDMIGTYWRAKDKGVRLVQFVGSTDQALRLARAMQGAGFRPEAFVLDPTAYNRDFLTGGSAVEGALVFLDFLPFEEASGNAEMRLYEQWLRQVSPGAAPTYFGLFAWSSARLFAEQAQALGGRLTRAALVARLRTVDGWTDHGLHAPQPVGAKRNSSCWRFVTVRDGAWVPAPGSPGYLCHGSTVVR